MDLVPLVSNADSKIILLMSNVNNNRGGACPYPRVSKCSVTCLIGWCTRLLRFGLPSKYHRSSQRSMMSTQATRDKHDPVRTKRYIVI